MAEFEILEVQSNGTLVGRRDGEHGTYDPVSKTFTPTGAPTNAQKPSTLSAVMQNLGQGLQDVSAGSAEVPPRVQGAMIGGATGIPGGLPGVIAGGAAGALAPPQETAGGAGASVGGALAQTALQATPLGRGAGLLKAGARIAGQAFGTASGMAAENAIRRSLGQEVPTASGASMYIVPALTAGLTGVAEGGVGILNAIARRASNNSVPIIRAMNNLEGQGGLSEGTALGDLADRLGSRLLKTFSGNTKSAAVAAENSKRMFTEVAPIAMSPAQVSEIASALKGSMARRVATIAKQEAIGAPISANAEEIKLLNKALKSASPEDPAAFTAAIFGSKPDDQVRVLRAAKEVLEADGNGELYEQLANEWLWQTVINPATKRVGSTQAAATFGARATDESKSVAYLTGEDLLENVTSLGNKIDEVFGPGRSAAIKDIATVAEMTTQGKGDFAGKGLLRPLSYVGNKAVFALSFGGGGAAAVATASSLAAGAAAGVVLLPIGLVMHHVIKNPQASKQFIEISQRSNPAAMTAFLRSLAAGTATSEDLPPVGKTGR